MTYSRRAARAIINLSSHSVGTPGTEQRFDPQPYCLVFGCTYRAWRNELCRNHGDTFEQVPRDADPQTGEPAPILSPRTASRPPPRHSGRRTGAEAAPEAADALLLPADDRENRP